MTQEWVDDDKIFSLKQIIAGRCDTTDQPNLAVWMSEDKDTNIFSVYLFIYFLEVTLKATWLTNLRGHDAHNKQQKMAQKRQYKFRSRRQQQESLLEYVGSVANSIFFP